VKSWSRVSRILSIRLTQQVGESPLLSSHLTSFSLSLSTITLGVGTIYSNFLFFFPPSSPFLLLCGLCPRCTVEVVANIERLPPPVHRTGVLKFSGVPIFYFVFLSLKIWRDRNFGFSLLTPLCPRRTFGTKHLVPPFFGKNSPQDSHSLSMEGRYWNTVSVF
jgi:hypothetical protein